MAEQFLFMLSSALPDWLLFLHHWPLLIAQTRHQFLALASAPTPVLHYSESSDVNPWWPRFWPCLINSVLIPTLLDPILSFSWFLLLLSIAPPCNVIQYLSQPNLIPPNNTPVRDRAYRINVYSHKSQPMFWRCLQSCST